MYTIAEITEHCNDQRGACPNKTVHLVQVDYNAESEVGVAEVGRATQGGATQGG